MEANKSMVRQNKEMQVIKKQIDDRIDELGSTVNKKEKGQLMGGFRAGHTN